jgi:MFS family permease
MHTKPWRWYDHISINLFWLGLNIRNTAVGSVFLPYLVDMFVSGEVKNTALGAMRTAGLIIAMLAQPAMGLLSDRNTSRFGRRRPFIFIGVLLDLIFLAAVGLAGSYWALLAAILLLQFSSNISHGALQGFIPDLAPEDQRGRASGVKAIMELLPLILVGFTVGQLVGAGQLGWAVVATCAGLFVTMVLTMILVRETPLADRPTTPLGPPLLRVLGMLAGIGMGAAAGLIAGGLLGGLTGLIVWPLAGAGPARAWGVGVGGLVAMAAAVVVGVWAGALATLGPAARRQSSFTWWVVNRLLFLAAVTSIQGSAPYFLMHAFSLTREAAVATASLMTAAAGVFTIVTALPAGWLADRFGHRMLVGVSGVIASLGTFIMVSTMWFPNQALVYLAGGVIGLASGLFMTINWALGAELAPAAEAGRYLGVSNLAGAGAGMVGAGIGGVLADYLNAYQPGLGYFAIFSCYGILLLLSVVSLAGVKRGR